MKMTKKMNLVLGINIFITVGVSVALVFAVTGIRRDVKTLKEEAYQDFLMEDLTTKSRQWAISIEPLLMGDTLGTQDLYYLTTVFLEDGLSSLKTLPLPAEERKLVERISFRFHATKSKIERLPMERTLYVRAAPPHALIKEIAGNIEELFVDVDALRVSRKIGRRR